jgi:hypothetical protein
MELITGRVPSLAPPIAHRYDQLWSWLQDPGNQGQWVATPLVEVGNPSSTTTVKAANLRHAANRAGLHIAVVHDKGLLFVKLRVPEVTGPATSFAAKASPKPRTVAAAKPAAAKPIVAATPHHRPNGVWDLKPACESVTA